ncbi:MAG: hypothetical protein KJ583_00290 [Nanoarchaeota archaeon]|nr:hypothetical protein [Nanoarchaeota archaeon]MBU1269467.1 hypothetical protein [Nanoarchaeota archaeon]MBU1603727.1 hypothetical protein [Nanoarchaeota archaeon]MBU2443030.1 hypothetical protein [Nanoarchaeota archaeon]
MFGKEELKIVNQLNNPFKLQEYINSLEYNADKRVSVSDIIKYKKADCMEAAVFAVLVLKHHGYDAFLIDLEAVRDEDHVLVVYKKEGRYGSVAQSKFLNLRQRMPVYSSIRELVMSYFDNYFNFYGELALRAYSEPVKIDTLVKQQGIKSVKMINAVEKELQRVKHQKLVDELKLPKVSYKKFWSEVDITPGYVKIGNRYAKK